jgi:hypothetical protein
VIGVKTPFIIKSPFHSIASTLYVFLNIILGFKKGKISPPLSDYI